MRIIKNQLKKALHTNHLQYSTEEATSSVEIDSSATESNNNNPQSAIRPSNDATPNSDSYVSTSETVDPPAQSKAQVLEELKARIRELEGSPHYKCFICKVSARKERTELALLRAIIEYDKTIFTHDLCSLLFSTLFFLFGVGKM